MVLLGVLEGVADEFHPQRLQLDLLHLLLLQTQRQRFHQVMREVTHALVQFPHTPAHHDLLLEGLVELEHVEVGHEDEVVGGGLLERLHHEVVHECHVVEDDGGGLVEKSEGGVELVHALQGVQDGQQEVDDVVELEDPDEADLAAPAEDVVVGDLALPAGVIQLLVGRQLHQVVVERDQQFFANEALQVLGLGLDLVVLELAGLGECLYLLVEDDVADVVLADLADLDERHHDLQLAQAAALLLELLDQRLQQHFLLPLLALLLEQPH